MDDTMNTAHPYPIFSGQLPHKDRSGCVPLSDLMNLLFRNAGAAMGFSSGRFFRMPFPACVVTFCGSTFGFHVGLIVLYCSEKEMVGANTGAVVAVMQHPEIIRDLSVMQNPGNSMCGLNFSTSAAKRDPSVPGSIEGAEPEPTSRSLSNARPKSCSERTRFLLGAQDISAFSAAAQYPLN